MRDGSSFFLGLIFFLWLHPFPARAAEGDRPAEIAFSFLEELRQAQPTREGGERIVTGEWTGGRFHFEGLPALTDIFVIENLQVEGRTRPAIWFQPWRDFASTLTFSSVPAGRRLRIFFALGDLDFQQGKPVPVYFEVWMGRKKLLDTQVSTKGWKEQTFDLTLAYLLQRKYRLSFRIRGSGDKRPTNFVFYGYLIN